jgi:Fe-Mn family superoxide dismutase
MPPAHLEITRRRLLGALTLGSSTVLACATRHAGRSPEPVAAEESIMSPQEPELVPLPFRPDALRGISEKMIVSHHRNNYGGAVRNLAAARRELAGLGKDAPGFVVAALRDRELTFANSKTLHEAYFGNLGGDGKIGKATDSALSAAFGSAGAWEQQFRASAAGLGGGSGWVVLSFELATAQLRIVGSGHHTQAQAEAVPLLVLDMYEHAYHIDYGAEAARYIDAFFQNVNWDEVERRRERAEKAATILRRA